MTFFFFYNLSQRKAYLTLGAMLNFQMERKLVNFDIY